MKSTSETMNAPLTGKKNHEQWMCFRASTMTMGVDFYARSNQ